MQVRPQDFAGREERWARRLKLKEKFGHSSNDTKSLFRYIKSPLPYVMLSFPTKKKMNTYITL